MKKLLIAAVIIIVACLIWNVASASTSLYSLASVQLNQASPNLSSGAINASGHENLAFSFSYEAESIDNGDSFTYGWSAGGTDHDLGTVPGINNGPVGDETGSVNASLPLGTQVSDLSVYVRATVNAGTDQVNLSSISLAGDALVIILPPAPTGDITNDESEFYSTIQAAVDGTDAGGTVTVPAGTYAENVNVTKPVTLQGAGAGLSIVDAGNLGAAFAINSDDVTIDGFTIENGGGALNSGIWMADPENVTVSHNTFTNNMFGIWADCSGNCIIEHNLFDGNNLAGGSGAGGISADSTVGLVIRKNEFKNETVGNPILLQAVGLGAHTDVVVSGNSLHDNAFSGVYALGISGGVFDGNTIVATDATGLSFSGGNSEVTISNNTITNSARGIRIEDAGYGFGPNSAFTFSGNTFSNNSEYNVGLLPGGYDGTEFDAPPNIALIGDANMTVFTSNGFVDPGATATDNMGNLLPVSVSGSVTVGTPGLYTLTYSATDIFGHTSSVARTVLVKQSGNGGGSSNNQGGVNRGGNNNQGGNNPGNNPNRGPGNNNAGGNGNNSNGRVLGAFTEAEGSGSEDNGQVLGAFFSVIPPSQEYQIAFLKNQLAGLLQELLGLLQGELAAAIAAQGQ